MMLEEAQYLAGQIVQELTPYCSKIEVAGSIRRGKLAPKDIEIVCIPKFAATQATLFDDPKDSLLDPNRWANNPNATNLLGGYLNQLLKHPFQAIRTDLRKDKAGKESPFGPKYYRISWQAGDIHNYQPVDIFAIIPPADFWVQMVIRTGPAEFSHWLVTKCKEQDICFTEGHIEHILTHQVLPCSKEEDVFTLSGIEYLEPSKRDQFRIFYMLDAK